MGNWVPYKSFHQKFARKFLFLIFKAPKVPLFTRMRAYSEKQSCNSIKNLPFCFSEYTRIRVIKGTFGALKFKNRNFRANFW